MNPVRFLLALLALAATFALGTPRAAAADVSRDPFSLSAKSVTFYADRFVIVGDEDVVVTLSDGTRITGNTFQMDLRLNRFIIAGGVRVTFGDRTIEGAAFSEFLDFHRTYFVPITTEPDRWTFVNGDFAHPLLGREMPGDVFFLPEMGDEHAFIRSRRATIVPRQSVRFAPASINSGAGWAPTPTWFMVFSNNPNFAQNSLAGANVDVAYPFAGSSNALTAAHLRYETVDGLFGSLEQHLVTDRAYAVASINPVTRPGKQYNLIAYDRASPNLGIQVFLQENAFQHGFSQPYDAAGYAHVQITEALRRSYLQLNTNAYYDSLLANPAPLTYYVNPSYPWTPNHPVDASLLWQGFDHRINKLPLYFRLRSGFGYAHDGLSPIFGIGGVAWNSLWYHSAGASLYSSPLRVNRDKLSRDTLLTVTADSQRQWFSAPHYIDTMSTGATLSKAFDRRLSAYVGYSVTQTSDHFGAQQLEAYPPTIPTSLQTGETYPGYAAFQGFATSRSLVVSVLYIPSTRIGGSLIYRSNRDFPVPIPEPGFPPGPGYNVTASPYGVAPQLLTANLRIRITPTIQLDLTRAYSFGWGNWHLSPQWGFQIEK